MVTLAEKVHLDVWDVVLVMHVKYCYIWQVLEQPSPSTLLPSSHGKMNTKPSPQIYWHWVMPVSVKFCWQGQDKLKPETATDVR